MKTCVAFTASMLLTLLSIDSATAVRTYLKKLPNGDTAAFEQALGHVGETSKPNAFGELFSSSGGEWNEKLCKATFPGTDMTVGAAFGDPCCTWKVGGKADFAVEPFTTAPKKTECAANKAPAPAAPAPAPAGKPTDAAPSKAPESGKPAGKPSTGGNLTTSAPAPAGKPSAGKPAAGKTPTPLPSSKCGVKKEAKSLEDDDDSNDDDENEV